MSEPFYDDYIDWSQGDLLDACYATGTIDPQLLSAGVDHGRFKCANCLATSVLLSTLEHHGKTAGHFAFRCNIHGCAEEFFSWRERGVHQLYPHILGHGRVGSDTPFDCSQCHTSLRSKAELLRHAKVEQHQPYACECGAQFSRIDVLNRHLLSNDTENPKYPCMYCKRHRGAEAFKRKDHLTQHIRNYHHHEMDPATDEPLGSDRMKYNFPICSHEDCPRYRDPEFKKLPSSEQKKSRPFSTQSEYTKHMKDEHNQCTFPCNVPQCPRIGRKGYFREKDLLKHRSEKHPDAAPYVVSKRELRIACTEPGCNATYGGRQAWAWHRFACHGIDWK